MYKDLHFRGCSDTEEENLIGTDGEETFHSDFKRKEGVVTLPDFVDYFTYPGVYEQSIGDMETSKSNLAKCIKAYKNPVEQIGKA